MNYLYHLCVIASVYVMLSVSLDLLVGHLGLLVLCQSAFFAGGAYTYAILTLKLGLPIPVAVCMAALTGGGMAAAMAAVARRLRGDAVVLASFALLLLVGDLVKNLRTFTGGLDGLAGIPPLMGASRVGVGVYSQVGVAVLAALCCWVAANSLTSGRYARLFHALRDDTHAAVGLGVQPLAAYMVCFSVAGAIAGLSGAIYSSYASFINPNVFGPDVSILLMTMVLVGGAATRGGPALGALVLLAVPEAIRLAANWGATVGAVNFIVMGIVLMVFASVRPRGILGGYEFQ